MAQLGTPGHSLPLTLPARPWLSLSRAGLRRPESASCPAPGPAQLSQQVTGTEKGPVLLHPEAGLWGGVARPTAHGAEGGGWPLRPPASRLWGEFSTSRLPRQAPCRPSFPSGVLPHAGNFNKGKLFQRTQAWMQKRGRCLVGKWAPGPQATPSHKTGPSITWLGADFWGCPS